MIQSTSISSSYPNFTSSNNFSFLTLNGTVITNGYCDITKAGSLENVLYVLFFSILMVANLLGNSMVLLAVMMSPPLRSRVGSYFVASLACSDLMLGIFQIPFRISEKLYEHYFCHNLSGCYVLLISDAFGNVASILNLFLISVDRFLAIKMPFRYEELLPKSRANNLIVSVWIFSAFWSLTGIFRWNPKALRELGILSVAVTQFCKNNNRYFYAISVFGIYLPVLVCITIASVTILHIAITQIRAIEATTVSIPIQRRLLETDDKTAELEKHRTHRHKTFFKELKATKSVAIVYLAFVICWLPSCVINIIVLINQTIFPELKGKDPHLFLFLYYLFIQILPVTNTMVNPLIYSFSNKQFRNAFHTVCDRLLKNKQLQGHSAVYSPNLTNRNNIDLNSTNHSISSLNIANVRILWKPE